jgi:hypothetical protein
MQRTRETLEEQLDAPELAARQYLSLHSLGGRLFFQ